MEQRTDMGMVLYAWGIHARNQWAGRHAGMSNLRAFIEECRRLGAGGLQCPVSHDDSSEASELRRLIEGDGLHFEAVLNLPRTADDVQRFEQDLTTAMEVGASLARVVIMPGRRYEEFDSLEAFRDAEGRGRQLLEWAAPVAARHRFRLAVENHKDQRIEERLALLRRIGSEWVGMCVDLGNSFALMEDPIETARAYAPHAMTVHIKDQALREYDKGFLFADVPLGEGFLDLPALVDLLRKAKPAIRFNLELITRDALEVPILTPGYWSTLADVPARDLARTLRLIRQGSHSTPFIEVSKLSVADQLKLEESNVRQSLKYAHDQLGI
jgi:sugar phosphate isomerase/epimerase